jgi:hypothetical protein
VAFKRRKIVGLRCNAYWRGGQIEDEVLHGGGYVCRGRWRCSLHVASWTEPSGWEGKGGQEDHLVGTSFSSCC